MISEPKTGFVGFTDTGQPLVLAEGCCEHWLPGKNRTLNSKTCWYCRYADFRKITGVMLTQSICRCPDNRTHIMDEMKNEELGGHEK